MNALATTIASWFGLKLKWEGPKRLLEVLIKPRVLFSAVVLNVAFVGAYHGYGYWKTLASPMWRVKQVNQGLEALGSTTAYSDWTFRINQDAGVPASANPAPIKMRQVWQKQLSKGVFGAVSLSGSSAFAGSDDGYVYELSRESGAIIRRFYIGTVVTPEPMVWKSHLFVGEGEHDTPNARIYSFDLTSGKFIGAFQTRGHTEGTPVIAEFQGVTQLFVMAGSDGLYAIDPSTLQERWHQKLGHTDSEVRVVDGVVYFATGVEKGAPENIRRAFALDFKTGKVIWSADLAASGWMAPVVAGSRVCYGLGEIYGPSRLGQLVCFGRSSGQAELTVTFDSPVLGIPYLSGNTLVVSMLNGEVCAIRYPEGFKIWCKPGEGTKTYASVTHDGHGRFIYPARDLGVIALDRETGQMLGQWKPGPNEGTWGKVFSRVTVASDGWFLSDMDGNIRKLAVTE